jgi:CDP-4-dehydro-6-deoxyglucose reductase
MTFKVTLQPSGAQFDAPAHQSLLQSALEAGFFPPHRCRSGACGTCKSRLMSGRVDHGDSMVSVLSAAEREQGAFLFCCATPLTDLVVERGDIELPGEIKLKRLPARVHTARWLSEDCLRLTLELPGHRRLCFRPGQCVDVLHENGQRSRHPLQPCSTPHVLAIDVRRADGDLSAALLIKRPGANLRIEGPFDPNQPPST